MFDASIDTLASLSARVTVLELRLARKRPVSIGNNIPRMTRLDRTPFGWKPNPRNTSLLIEDVAEQAVIFALIEARQNPAQSLRGLCHFLDSHGHKRRGGKRWVGAHSTVRDILIRHDAETSAAATARVQERIAAIRAKAADTYFPKTLTDDEARARARGRI